MFEQPSLSEYIRAMQGFDYFITAMIFLAIPIMVLVLFFSKKKHRSLKMKFNLWTILGIGLILRLPLMDQPAWYDETFTSAISKVGLSDFMTAVAGDVHPPLYYMVVRLFTDVLGHNDFAMRLPALLSSMGLIVTMYHIAKTYGGVRMGKWAAFITAVLPVTIYYATEARYPIFLALMLSIAFIGIQKRKLWTFAIPLAIVALTHVNGWFYIVIMGAVWILSYKSIRALILPVASMGVWFPVALSQSSDIADGFWLPQWSPWQHIIEMTIGSRFLGVGSAIIPMIITVTIIGVAVWLWRKNADLHWLAVVIAVPLAQWIVGIIWHPIYLPRTLMFSALLLIIPVAWWLDNYANMFLAIAGLLAVMVAYGSMFLSDRGLDAEIAIQQCAGYETIYATNVKTAILARHFAPDARIIVYEQGNSTQQQLPIPSQQVMFDGIDNLLEMDSSDVCVVSRVNAYNTEQEMNHLEAIYETFNTQPIFITEDSSAYFVILRLEDES